MTHSKEPLEKEGWLCLTSCKRDRHEEERCVHVFGNKSTSGGGGGAILAHKNTHPTQATDSWSDKQGAHGEKKVKKAKARVH